MSCSKIHQDLSLYSDGMINKDRGSELRAHLDVCPLCRQKNADYLQIKADLRLLRRPEITSSLQQDIKRSIRAELLSRKRRPSSPTISEWLQMRVMPYAVGVTASVVIGSAFLVMMLSGMLRPPATQTVRDIRSEPVFLASSTNVEDRLSIVSPIDFINSRSAFSSESPSINPEGALVAVTKYMVGRRMRNQELVVVADVFGNGLAEISEVVESPSDKRTLEELEKAFRSHPASSPFVPAVMENRPENVRIVLKIQTVDVDTSPRSPRRRS